MNKRAFWGVALLGTAIALISINPAQAAIRSEGEWAVTGKAGSGAVGDTVPIDFSFALISDRCAKMDVYIETVDEARQKVDFVGAAVPAAGASVSAERVDWAPTEFENSVIHKYRVNAQIARGAVGDEIDGFYLYAWCDSSPNSGIYFGVHDGIKVKVIAKKTTAAAKPAVTKTSLSATDRKAPDFITSLAVPTTVDRLFTQTFGRKITKQESVFWKHRARTDKPTETKLKGAMAFFKAKGKTYDAKIVTSLLNAKK